jgi:hypothetical protein
MTEHTPTPWYADPDLRDGMEWNIHIVQHDDPNMRVCFMTSDGPSEANAAFIVKAVNAHGELVAAARKALNYIENTESELGIKLASGDALRAALGVVEQVKEP